MEMRSTYPGKLILPNGDEIATGADVTIAKDAAKNPGVIEWITNGWLVDPASIPAPEMAADLLVITNERDDLLAKVAELQAALDAATAPKK